MTIGLIFNRWLTFMSKNWNLAETYGNLLKRGKGFFIAENCTETNYIRFQLTETLHKPFSFSPHCWNWSETCTTGFRWRKLDGIQLKLYNSIRIAETIQETWSPSLYIVSAVFQFCWNGIFQPVSWLLKLHQFWIYMSN